MIICPGTSGRKEPPTNYTYIVRCSDGSYYCGWTNDIEKRLAAHNSGKGGKCTRSRYPVVLVHLEEFETKEEAMSREWHIKKLTRAQKEELIASAPYTPCDKSS